MFSHSTTVRVRYADTDQMGMVYYGNYPTFYEVGRVEAMRSLAINYKDLEEQGIMMPVLECHIKYIAPARYDDLLKVVTYIKSIPTTTIRFDYEIYSPNHILLNTGYTILVFVNSQSFKPIRTPETVIAPLKEYFT